MSVVHLSTNDFTGGAARAAFRLHRGLSSIGEASHMFVRNKDSRNEDVRVYDRSSGWLERLKDRFKRRWLNRRFNRYQETRPEGLEIFSQARTLDGHRVVDALPDADVYNLHWIRGFIDPSPFFQQTQQPVVWTLHDMNPFTGGCHYNVRCNQYRESCGQCPQLGSTDENDLSRSVWSRKERAYREAIENGRLEVVAPSEWLAEEARRSTLFSKAPVHVIPNGLDHETFHPRNTDGLRSALSIPADHRVLLFVADSTQNRRKGFDLLQDALSGLDDEAVALVSIGSHEPELEVSVPHVHLGAIQSDVLLSVFYSLADLFVIPSRQDNLPNTVLESMACGTPVVGFDTGGIPDMVRPGETGWLAESENARSLRETIEHALCDDVARRRRGARCRDVVEEEYTLQVQARAYKKLYERLLTQNEK
ncbi:glycosyltransferase family 4 protein [Salinibacter ruber]|uniref:glycosyltransferase family 4 protein n=1 Tax=Salinibacter ruber TaxID=146919 RepID=UPI002168497A|nr:glycosyltransferase family 4 protein [Salinibacter ruber]